MKIEYQVCSLKLAKRLKELGVKQDSLIYWEKCPERKNEHCLSYVDWHDSWTGEWGDCHLLKDQEVYSAFTVAELGEMLPKFIVKDEIEYYYTQMPSRHCDKWIIFYRNSFEYCSEIEEKESKKEADARAKMLIYLIENGLIKEKDNATSQRKEGEQ